MKNKEVLEDACVNLKEMLDDSVIKTANFLNDNLVDECGLEFLNVSGYCVGYLIARIYCICVKKEARSLEHFNTFIQEFIKPPAVHFISEKINNKKH